MRSSDWSSDVCSSDLAAEPGRVEQELVLWPQKLDVDEELDRLDSHVVEIRRIFTQEKPVGRRLDFLLQEFNRDANTLGSKSVDARTRHIAVELQVDRKSVVKGQSRAGRGALGGGLHNKQKKNT